MFSVFTSKGQDVSMNSKVQSKIILRFTLRTPQSKVLKRSSLFVAIGGLRSVLFLFNIFSYLRSDDSALKSRIKRY